jgi:hypothetical protein
MIVGMCRMELSLPGNRSLKGKRSVVRRVCDGATGKFNVSMAEIDHLDLLDSAVIGFAVVSNDGSHASAMIDRIVRFVEVRSDAPVVDQDVELTHFGDASVSTLGSWDDFEEEE